MSDPAPTSSQAAPGDLELVRSFVNTLELPMDAPLKDALATPEALSDWLGSQAIKLPEASLADWQRTVAVREALRTVLLSHSGEALEDELRDALKLLNAEAARAPLALRLDGDGRLEPQGTGLDAFLGRLFAAIYTATQNGTWQRLKACRHDACQWAFYDHSKNRSGKWCTMAVCGSRLKTRAYRERRAAGGS
jgi:predicted RNA-binding Zn ribbon-like protein